jgi:hypothetical protein
MHNAEVRTVMRRRHARWNVLAIAAMLSLLCHVNAVFAQSIPLPPAEESTMGPRVVDRGICWQPDIELQRELIAEVRGELARVKQTYGDDGSRIAPILREYAETVRMGPVAPALAGVMIVHVWEAELLADRWEYAPAGEAPAANPERDARFSAYYARLFEAVAAVCGSAFPAADWTLGEPAAAPTGTPPPDTAKAVLRGDVCWPGWRDQFAGRAQRYHALADEAEVTGDVGLVTAAYRSISEEERSAATPPSGVAVSVFFTMLADELAVFTEENATDLADPARPEPFFIKDDERVRADLDRTHRTLDIICEEP